MSQQDLHDILSVSRPNNTAGSISGMLLYKDGEFMQALEGDKNKLEGLFKAICSDERHKDVIVLSRKEIDERSFPFWSMGFNNLSGQQVTALIDPSSFFAKGNDFEQGNTAYNFLSSFYTAED